MMIEPTIGHIVWYWPHPEYDRLMAQHSPLPFAATVVHVWGDRCVNLAIHDHSGGHWSRNSVTLRQPKDALPPEHPGGHCEWMPYEVIGYAKTGPVEG
jgi:hypothetical protein